MALVNEVYTPLFVSLNSFSTLARVLMPVVRSLETTSEDLGEMPIYKHPPCIFPTSRKIGRARPPIRGKNQ
jgi:hypothetical protein